MAYSPSGRSAPRSAVRGNWSGGPAPLSNKSGALVLVGALLSGTASAGVYTDDLSKCLVESTSPDDRTELVKWMFVAASAHPAIGSLANVTPEGIASANKAIGSLFMRLLTESCKDQTQKALRYEGPATIQMSFAVLGQVAGTELFSNPLVVNAMSGIEQHLDASKLQGLQSDGTE